MGTSAQSEAGGETRPGAFVLQSRADGARRSPATFASAVRPSIFSFGRIASAQSLYGSG
jgi:hypothetical protein